jgi:hypothetical protein
MVVFNVISYDLDFGGYNPSINVNSRSGSMKYFAFLT